MVFTANLGREIDMIATASLPPLRIVEDDRPRAATTQVRRAPDREKRCSFAWNEQCSLGMNGSWWRERDGAVPSGEPERDRAALEAFKDVHLRSSEETTNEQDRQPLLFCHVAF